jgi:4-cresol dehydrogenase (hydroxylating)
VTRLGIWLLRKPEQVLGFFASVSESRLPELVERLRELHLGGVLQNPIHLYNSTRIHQGQSPLTGLDPQESVHNPKRFTLIGDWNLWGGFFGERSLCKARLDVVRRALSGLCRVHPVTNARVRTLMTVAKWLRRMGLASAGDRCEGLAMTGRDGMEKLWGRPSDNAVRAVCARIAGDEAWEETRTADLRDFGVGLYWLTHLCPLTKDKLTKCLETIHAVLNRWQLDPHLTLTVISSRVALCNVTLYFDKTLPEAAQAADLCRADLTSQLMKHGFPPYRTGIHSMEAVNAAGPQHAMLLKTLKSALDPQGILAPGRYVS